MAQIQEQFWEDRTHVRGRFHEMKQPGKRAPLIRLCTISDADYKIVSGRKRKRSPRDRNEHLNQLYRVKLLELQDQAQQNQEHEEPKTEANKHTIAEAVQKYREENLLEMKESTCPSYSRHLDYWEKHCGSLLLSEMTPARIGEQRDELKKHTITRKGNGKGKQRSSPTVNRYMACLQSLFTACIKDFHWYESVNPCARMRQLKEPRGRERDPLTPAELDRLIDIAYNGVGHEKKARIRDWPLPWSCP